MPDLQQDPRWLQAKQARWFAGKGRDGYVEAITPLTWYAEPAADNPGVRSELLSVRYPDGGQERYQLLLSYRDGAPRDALNDPTAVRLLMSALNEAAVAPDASAGYQVTILDPDGLPAGTSARPFTGEQSNSNVHLDDQAVLKVFRRLESGRSLDVELLAALNQAGVREVIPLLGWLSATDPDTDDSFDLAMVTHLVPLARDGWDVALAAASDNTDFTEAAASLGRALARVHTALRTALGTTEVAGEHIRKGMHSRLAAAVQVVPQLTGAVEALVALFDLIPDGPLTVQRVHGDFHLGQTLQTPTGWYLIDFEGEPMKTLIERAQPDSVWRDVAGMVRSLAYAGASAAKAAPGGELAWQQGWVARAQDAFLAAYRLDGLTADEQHLLTAYTVDKAIYEATYEVRNRPEWTPIPLGAIESLIIDKKG